MYLVKIENGQVFADSFKVATVFGRQHKHVLRDIEVFIANINGLKSEPVNESQENQLEFNEPKFGLVKKYFILSSYMDLKGESRKLYKMTRDGFSLLVMGFTGQKALEWKLKYIEAFNYMESSINQVKELDILNSEEWRLLKGSAKSISHLEKNIKIKLKEIEKIIRSMEDDMR